MFGILWSYGPHSEPPRAEMSWTEAFDAGISCLDFRSGLIQSSAIAHIVDYSAVFDVANGRVWDPFHGRDLAARWS
jgi:hypothetical protein